MMKLLIPGFLILAACMPFVKLVEAKDPPEYAPVGSGGVALLEEPYDSPQEFPVADRLVPCSCPFDYKPVCGTNGNEYANKCVLDCVSADNVRNGRPPIRVANNGHCPRVTCNCPQIISPVCGTDGQTYVNDCFRRCENARRALYGLPPVLLAYRGICGTAPCICSSSVIPVCGTDGRTYRNVCVMQCFSRSAEAQGLPPILQAYQGPCKNEYCLCPAVKKEVCASDGKTYSNQCFLDCENRKRVQLGLKPLTVQYPGPCFSCVCPKVYDPVCACDYRTRGNPCILKCENRRRAAMGLPPLAVLYKGACRLCDCGSCPRRWNPVCGSDNRVYWNICWFNCNNDCRAASGLPLIKLVKC